MYLLAKFDDHRSKGNEDISSYIGSHMNTLVRHIEEFSKSFIPINNPEVLDTACRKTRRRMRSRRQAVDQRYTFHANAITTLYEGKLSISESPGLMHG